MNAELLRRLPPPKQGGFTLIEVLIAVTIVMVAMGGAISTLTSTSVLGQSNVESTIAYQAARSTLERIQAETFVDIYRSYNADPSDDPFGVGTAPGPNFAVAGLGAQTGDLDGMAGRVVLPVSPDGTLREDLDDPLFSMPRDLNGDGVIDGDDRSNDHIMLPVRVRVEWMGKSGARIAEFGTFVSLRR